MPMTTLLTVATLSLTCAAAAPNDAYADALSPGIINTLQHSEKLFSESPDLQPGLLDLQIDSIALSDRSDRPHLLGDDALVRLAEYAPRSPFGQAESWRWTIQGSIGSNFDDAEQFLAGIGFSYFIFDDISLNLEFNAMYFDQRGHDAFGGNFNLLFRWHFYQSDDRTWSLYADAGAGMLLTSEEVPRFGSNFNFTPQAGAGISFDLTPDARMFIGSRWHHISNANLYDENPGRDSGMVYAMVSFPF